MEKRAPRRTQEEGKVKSLEAQIVVENTGNYDDTDVDYIMDTYKELVKYIGFEDNRRDSRYIVKFHDIPYYTPYGEDNDEEFWNLFDMFCQDQYECLQDTWNEEDIDIDMMLTRMSVGHYQAFLVDIPKIYETNAIDLAMEIYDEVGYRGPEYVNSYVYMVNILQELEDDYMEYWVEFLRANEYMPEKVIKQIEDKYKSDKERRK